MTLACLLLSCFPSRPASQPLLPNTAVPDPASPVRAAGCVFCQLAANGIEGVDRVRFEDEAFVVFKDRSEGARQHLLVIPRGHVAASVKDLSALDIPMLHRMQALAEQALTQGLTSPASPTQFKFGFHIPPFTSVAHIHLHAFELPHASAAAAVEFRSTRRSAGKPGKRLGWFVEMEQVLDILEASKKVAVKPVSV